MICARYYMRHCILPIAGVFLWTTISEDWRALPKRTTNANKYERQDDVRRANMTEKPEIKRSTRTNWRNEYCGNIYRARHRHPFSPGDRIRSPPLHSYELHLETHSSCWEQICGNDTRFHRHTVTVMPSKAKKKADTTSRCGRRSAMFPFVNRPEKVLKLEVFSIGFRFDYNTISVPWWASAICESNIRSLWILESVANTRKQRKSQSANSVQQCDVQLLQTLCYLFGYAITIVGTIIITVTCT